MKKRITKSFDLSEAKSGAELCTRDGRNARIESFKADSKDYPIIALVDIGGGRKDYFYYTDNGERCGGCTSDSDLMIVAYEEERQQFKAFDKVLVRDSDEEKWVPAFFAYYDDDDYGFPYNVIGEICYNQCIKFEGNECLTGTTNKP